MKIQELRENVSVNLTIAKEFNDKGLNGIMTQINDTKVIDFFIFLAITFKMPPKLDFVIYFDVVKLKDEYLEDGLKASTGELVATYHLKFDSDVNPKSMCRYNYIEGFYDKEMTVKKVTDFKLKGLGCYNVVAYCLVDADEQVINYVVDDLLRYNVSKELILDGWKFEVV